MSKQRALELCDKADRRMNDGMVHCSLSCLADAIRELAKEDADPSVELARLRWDIDAYRGALGYSIPGNHNGKLWDGTTPVCGLCDARTKPDIQQCFDKELLEVNKAIAAELQSLRNALIQK